MAMGGHPSGALVTFLQMFRKERHWTKSDGASDEETLDSQSMMSSSECPPRKFSSCTESGTKPASLSSLPVPTKSCCKTDCPPGHNTSHPHLQSRNQTLTFNNTNKSSKWRSRLFTNLKSSRKTGSKELNSGVPSGVTNCACSEDLESSLQPYCWPSASPSIQESSDSSSHLKVLSPTSSCSPSLHDPQTQSERDSPGAVVMPRNISSLKLDYSSSSTEGTTREHSKPPLPSSLPAPCSLSHPSYHPHHLQRHSPASTTHCIDIPLLRDSPGVIPSAPCLRHLSPTAPIIAPNVFPFEDGKNHKQYGGPLFSSGVHHITRPGDNFSARSRSKLSRDEKQRLHVAAESSYSAHRSQTMKYTSSTLDNCYSSHSSSQYSHTQFTTISSSTSQTLFS